MHLFELLGEDQGNNRHQLNQDVQGGARGIL